MADRVRSPQELAARALAHARATANGSGAKVGSVAIANAAFDRTARELSRWVGSGGSHAMLSRALSKAKTEHPALAPVALLDVELRLAGVDDADDPQAVAKGLEMALESLFELLSRLVGADLAWQLVESSLSNDLPVPDASGNRDLPQ